MLNKKELEAIKQLVIRNSVTIPNACLIIRPAQVFEILKLFKEPVLLDNK